MTPIESMAWAILAGGAGVFTILAFRQVLAFRRDSQVFRGEIALLGERLETVRSKRKAVEKGPTAWNGIRKFDVIKKVREKGGIYSFYLTPHDRKLPLPPFRPGQFLTFNLKINGKAVARCYSLSDSPKHDYYRVSIKRCLAPRDSAFPEGVASSYFHDHVNENDILDVKAPAGGFAIDPAEGGPIVLSGSGVGLTPVLSMMNALVEINSRRETWFFYGVRNSSEDMIAEQVKEWRALNKSNFHIHICYSSPSDSDVLGEDYDHESRVDIALLKSQLPSNNYNFYTCGPGPMMQGLRDGLTEWGVPEENVHDEAFIAVRKVVEVGASKVELKKSEKTIQVSGEATHLWDLANDAGVEIPYICLDGKCGTCQTAIVSGKVKNIKTPEFKAEAGCCLPCICLPDGDLVLDA